MDEPAHGEITDLLLAWSGWEASALDKLIPLVYAELRRLAHRYMWHERADHTLQTSESINEAYLRLVDAGRVTWQDRAHFLAVAAQAMRRLLAEYAR
jgi:RNA polymerase sigma factor (TIGR02999 family)